MARPDQPFHARVARRERCSTDDRRVSFPGLGWWRGGTSFNHHRLGRGRLPRCGPYSKSGSYCSRRARVLTRNGCRVVIGARGRTSPAGVLPRHSPLAGAGGAAEDPWQREHPGVRDNTWSWRRARGHRKTPGDGRSGRAAADRSGRSIGTDRRSRRGSGSASFRDLSAKIDPTSGPRTPSGTGSPRRDSRLTEGGP